MGAVAIARKQERAHATYFGPSTIRKLPLACSRLIRYSMPS